MCKHPGSCMVPAAPVRRLLLARFKLRETTLGEIQVESPGWI
jgi:hypothetical protein